MDAAWIALAGTLFGGAGFKIVEHWIGRAGARDNTATSLRTELRTELVLLRGEVDKMKNDSHELEREIDQWRNKYYRLVAVIAKGDIESALRYIEEK